MRFQFFRSITFQPKSHRSRVAVARTFSGLSSYSRLFLYATRPTGIAIFLCLCGLGILSGCSQNRNAVLELERENRTLEDALYQMKYQTTMATRQAARAQQESDRLRTQLAVANEKANNASSYYSGSSGSPNGSGNSERVDNTPHSTYFQSVPPQPTSAQPTLSPTSQPEIIPTPTPIARNGVGNRILPTSATLSVPATSLAPSCLPIASPMSNATAGTTLAAGTTPVGIATTSPIATSGQVGGDGQNITNEPNTKVYPATVGRNNPYGIVAIPSVQDSAEVTEITLNATLTSGWDIDGVPGDEGIRVLIEPRDRYGRTVRTTGETQISLVDPQIPSAQGYCGTWNFDAKQASTSFVYSTVGEGMYFELPLTQAVTHSELMLFVRFMDRNGRKLESHRSVTLQPRGMTTVPAQNATALSQNATSPATASNPTPMFYMNTLAPTNTLAATQNAANRGVWQQSNRTMNSTLHSVANPPTLERLNTVQTGVAPTNVARRTASSAAVSVSPVSYTASTGSTNTPIQPTAGAITRRPITLAPQASTATAGNWSPNR